MFDLWKLFRIPELFAIHAPGSPGIALWKYFLTKTAKPIDNVRWGTQTVAAWKRSEPSHFHSIFSHSNPLMEWEILFQLIPNFADPHKVMRFSIARMVVRKSIFKQKHWFSMFCWFLQPQIGVKRFVGISTVLRWERRRIHLQILGKNQWSVNP